MRDDAARDYSRVNSNGRCIKSLWPRKAGAGLRGRPAELLLESMSAPCRNEARSRCRSIRPDGRGLDHRQPFCHFRPMMRGERLGRLLV